MLALTIVLIVLAAVNAVFTAWATVLDARHTSAVSRAMGATPEQLTAGLAAAQLLPALPALVAGIPLGIGLFKFANSGGALTVPPAWWLVLVVAGTLLLVGGLTAIPARLGAHRPISGILQAELA
jgi:putative ABC transport system permease protein